MKKPVASACRLMALTYLPELRITTMNRMTRVFALLALLAPLPAARATLVIDTVPVGNAGNAGEVQSQGTFGAVGYEYRIGTYEVTNDQYAALLNAVAATDTFGLFNPFMGKQRPRRHRAKRRQRQLHLRRADGHGQ